MLTGKKDKVKDPYKCPQTTTHNIPPSQDLTPPVKEKRRWSFRRSSASSTTPTPKPPPPAESIATTSNSPPTDIATKDDNEQHKKKQDMAVTNDVITIRLTIEEAAADLGWQLNGSGSFIANYYTGLPSDLFVQEASDAGLSISAGSACNSGMAAGSHVITAMLGEDRAGCSLRLSWDRLTKDCDLLDALEIVKKTDRMLRAYCPKEKVND